MEISCRPEVPLHLGAVHLDFLEEGQPISRFWWAQGDGISHSRSIWGHTGIHMLQAPSAFHTPALGPSPLRLQGRDTTHVRLAQGKEILHFFPFLFYIWIWGVQVNHKLGCCCVWVGFGEFFAFFLIFHLQHLVHLEIKTYVLLQLLFPDGCYGRLRRLSCVT